MIEGVLSRCKSDALGELAPLNTLLRRFATEAARGEARLFCDELVSKSPKEKNGLKRPRPPFLPCFLSAIRNREKCQAALRESGGAKILSR